MIRSAFIGILFLTFFQAFAQSDEALLDKLVSGDSAAIPVLAAYPDSVRSAALIASTYPQGFVRMGSLQEKSAEAFRKLAAGHDREKQTLLWDIARYPGLAGLLADSQDKKDDEWSQLLKNYPEKIRKAAPALAKNDHALLVEMEKVRLDFEKGFGELIKEYPEEVRSAFNTLAGVPELADVLKQEMNTTVALGDIYKRSPKLVEKKLASVSLELAKQRTLEYEAWKKDMKDDTAATGELKKVSAEYTSAVESDEEEYSPGKYALYVNYHFYPYPFWCGYPYWHPRPYWYPYPWWYQCGYYWSPAGYIVFIGPPHYYYGWWYFHYHHHHYHYPHVSHYYYRHYYGRREVRSGFSRSVAEWDRRNRQEFPSDWLKDDAGRPQRFREYGKLEMDVQEHNVQNPARPLNKEEFLQEHRSAYPALQKKEAARPPSIKQPERPAPDPRPRIPAKPPRQPLDKPAKKPSAPVKRPETKPAAPRPVPAPARPPQVKPRPEQVRPH